MKRIAGLYIAWLIAAVMLASAAVGRHPYSFYTLLRWICCLIFAYSAFSAHEKNRVLWVWVFGALAALYNPIFRVHLDRNTWVVVNWFTIGAIAVAGVLFWGGRRLWLSSDVPPVSRITMTPVEAEQILDVVSAALQDNSHPFGHHPISTLKGHDMPSILTALKLRIANEFLQLAQRADFEQQFAEGLRLYASIPWQIISSFVADNQIGVIGAKLVLSPIDPSTMEFADPQLASVETSSSFGDFCKSIGPHDPNYWQRVYARIGIEYTSKAPRGNAPVTVDT